MRGSAKMVNGFTVIEILIVIAILGMLWTIVLASANSARRKANYARALAEINIISKAMLLYQGDFGELPPIGDIYVDDINYPTGTCHVSRWATVMNTLVSGGYLTRPIYKDPWGNPYCYDDNDGVPIDDYFSALYTSGADGQLGHRHWTLDTPCPGTSDFSGSWIPGDDGDFDDDNIGILIPDDDTC